VQYPEIETDIPFAAYPPTFETLQARVEAAFKSIAVLSEREASAGVEVTDEDIMHARGVLLNTSRTKEKDLSAPGVVVHLKAILDEYDATVVQSAVQLRNYVTNKLIEDSTNPDPRVRLRCYELLGKISDVGLFTDKTEVTLRHRPTEELEQLLRERLMKTINADPYAVDTPTLTPSPALDLAGALDPAAAPAATASPAGAPVSAPYV